MPYPDKVLARDENVVLHVRPHLRTLVVPALVLLLIIGLGTFALVSATTPGLQYAVLLVAAGALAVLVGRPFLRWRTTHLILTTHRLLVREGTLARSGRDLAFDRVTEVSFERTLTERLLGSGTLVVENAGERGPVVVVNVPGVENVQATLYQLVQKHDERDR